jgi:hypothetical protein
MRDIRLKVWDTVRMKMMEPQGITFDAKDPKVFAVKVSGRSWEPVGKYEIIQWTGLSDENGINVYEGDFVIISACLYEVIWDEASAGFGLLNLKDSPARSIAEVKNGHIAGNKFENPNLAR